jgi:hypothetical protein
MSEPAASGHTSDCDYNTIIQPEAGETKSHGRFGRFWPKMVILTAIFDLIHSLSISTSFLEYSNSMARVCGGYEKSIN